MVSESDDKLPEETTSQKQTPLKSDSAVRREFSERTSLAHSRSNKGTITITVSTASVRDIVFTGLLIDFEERHGSLSEFGIKFFDSCRKV